MTSREVPQVTLFEVAYEIATLLIKSSNSAAAREDVGPLCLNVPVKLANDARTETHVDTCYLLAARKLSESSLTGP